MNNIEVRRGDIFEVLAGGRFNGGTTISGFRPAVIVSNNTGNHFSNCVEIVYLTSQDKKPLPTHARIMCRVPSTALCEQVATVGKEKLGAYIRTCNDAEMRAIDAALLVSLGLTAPETRRTETRPGGGGHDKRRAKAGRPARGACADRSGARRVQKNV